MTAFFAQGQEKAEGFIRRGVELWRSEGRIDEQTAETLLGSLSAPEVAQGMLHAGAHFAISVPLRFPFGAMARFLYTAYLRLQAEAQGLWHRERSSSARRLHTLPVMLFALLPGFGRLAYFFSPALMEQRLLLVIPLDQLSRKLPLKAYERLHLEALFIYWAGDHHSPLGLRRFSPSALVGTFKSRLRDLSPQAGLIGSVLALDTLVFAIGAYIYVNSGRTSTWWWDERGVVATLDAVQLLIGGVAGIAAYQVFWRRQAATPAEAFGIFLWGIGGMGLVLFALEDYFTIHEAAGRAVQTIIPGGLNSPDDIFILAYAVIGVAVLYVFHTELFARRGSTALLIAAAVSALVMVLTDVFAQSLALKALELPAQTLSDTLLMFAFVTRYKEVKALEVSESQHLSQFENAI